MAHEHVGDVDGVVHGDGVAASDGTEEANGDDKFQDGGHSIWVQAKRCFEKSTYHLRGNFRRVVLE